MKLKVTSTTKQLLEVDNIKSLSVPTQAGRIQILPGHIDLVVPIDLGKAWYEGDSGREEFYLMGGFLVLKSDEIMILADEADRSDNLVALEIEKAIEDAESLRSSSLPPAELIQLEKKLRYEKFKKSQL